MVLESSSHFTVKPSRAMNMLHICKSHRQNSVTGAEPARGQSDSSPAAVTCFPPDLMADRQAARSRVDSVVREQGVSMMSMGDYRYRTCWGHSYSTHESIGSRVAPFSHPPRPPSSQLGLRVSLGQGPWFRV